MPDPTKKSWREIYRCIRAPMSSRSSPPPLSRRGVPGPGLRNLEVRDGQ